MKTLWCTFLIISASVALSSCTKDELDAPDNNSIPSAMMIDDTDAIHQEHDSYIFTGGDDVPQVLEVNDDGDDESAGSNPDTENKK